MNTLSRLSVIGLLAVTAISAHAQDNPGRVLGIGVIPALFLLKMEEVQIDLALTAEQKSAIKVIQDENPKKIQAAFRASSGSGTPPDRTMSREVLFKVQQETETDLYKLLNPDQQKRIKELSIQISGKQAAFQPDVQKELSITDEQKAKLKLLQETSLDTSQKAMARGRSQELTSDEVQEILRKNRVVVNEEIVKILTADQLAKLTELGGKKLAKKAEGNG